MQKKLHIKIGDTVKVISGESKGREGKVVTIDREKMRATVEGVNMIKKNTTSQARQTLKVESKKKKVLSIFLTLWS